MQTVTVRGSGITLDLLLFRRFGSRYGEVVETALTENPGIADLGAFLPTGTVVRLPDLPEAPETTRDVVTLFG